jgi:peptidoglycan-N-acetylglucosamine deacetylase
MYFIKTPKLIQNLFPNFTWKMPSNDKVIYLTFDDGPIPEVTPMVLDILDSFNAKATFFCVGDNVRKYPEVFEQVINAGHMVGNHTYNHLSGWESENIEYYHNVRHCAKLVKSDLFRPPYGRMTPKQTLFLSRHYKIVMWDVLSGDFDPNISKEDCLANVINATGKGSIIVFHDSLKAKDKMMYALPRVMEHFLAKGYRFESLVGLKSLSVERVLQPSELVAA